MRILSWVQNKLSGSQEKNKFDTGSCSSRRTSTKEEFSDWPQSLLSIGTFGNNGQKESQERQNPPENLHSSRDLSDFSVEEVVKLQKELTKLLSHKPRSSTDGSEKGGERANHPLNRFLNFPSSLEVERRDCLKLCDRDGGENNGYLSPCTRIILNKAKDILGDKSNAIRKKSLSFLLKKMFVCRSGFAEAPSLRYQLPESRMEKLLRTILHNQIYTQSSSRMPTKKSLEKKPMEKKRYKDEMREKEDGNKWVMTDSEYIVLEI